MTLLSKNLIVNTYFQNYQMQTKFTTLLIIFLAILSAVSIIRADATQSDVQIAWVNTILPGVVNDIELDGDYAFLSTSRGLIILDISNPNNPNKISFIGLTSSCNCLDFDGDYVYIANEDGNINIFNISDSSKPQQEAIFKTTDSAKDIIVHENYAYIADGDHGIKVIDISNLSNIHLISQKNFANQDTATSIT